MASEELLELFTLGDDGMTAEKAPKAKKARLATGTAVEELTDMDKLWGNNEGEEEDGMDDQMEQYAEQHSIQSFLAKSEKLS